MSNRPCSPRLLDLLRECKAVTADSFQVPHYAEISNNLSAGPRQTLTLMSSRSGLDEDDFASFIQLFDLDFTNSGSRFDHEARIARTLQSHALSPQSHSFNALYNLVRRQALPEEESSGASANRMS